MYANCIAACSVGLRGTPTWVTASSGGSFSGQRKITGKWTPAEGLGEWSCENGFHLGHRRQVAFPSFLSPKCGVHVTILNWEYRTGVFKESSMKSISIRIQIHSARRAPVLSLTRTFRASSFYETTKPSAFAQAQVHPPLSWAVKRGTAFPCLGCKGLEKAVL